jgi:RNA polymerase sigma-70 factor (ECF subfamily)
MLMRVAVGRLGAVEAAEELVHDIFLGIWANRATWALRGPLRAYLLGALRNRMLNLERRDRLSRRWAADAASGCRDEVVARPLVGRVAAADESVRAAELRDAIAGAVRSLPARCREAFRLSREQQLSHQEIAACMGVSVGTVEVQIGRALAALRKQLAEWIR